MFESSKDSKTNEVLYLIATILFIISIIINFTGGNMVVGAASLMGFTGVGRTYLRIRKKIMQVKRRKMGKGMIKLWHD